MKIIISPAKKMNVDTDTYQVTGLPVFLEDTKLLMDEIRRPVSYTHLDVYKRQINICSVVVRVRLWYDKSSKGRCVNQTEKENCHENR